MINRFLYLDKPFKNVRLEAPKPRDANIIPPLQHIVAAAAVKTEVILKILFFISVLLYCDNRVEIVTDICLEVNDKAFIV